MGTSGLGLFAIIAIVLGVLKLTGTITLSWWWIAAIFFTPLLLVLVVFALFGLVGLFVAAGWRK